MDLCKIFMQTLPNPKILIPFERLADLWDQKQFLKPRFSTRTLEGKLFFSFNLSITTFKLGEHLLVNLIKEI